MQWGAKLISTNRTWALLEEVLDLPVLIVIEVSSFLCQCLTALLHRKCCRYEPYTTGKDGKFESHIRTLQSFAVWLPVSTLGSISPITGWGYNALTSLSHSPCTRGGFTNAMPAPAFNLLTPLNASSPAFSSPNVVALRAPVRAMMTIRILACFDCSGDTL